MVTVVMLDYKTLGNLKFLNVCNIYFPQDDLLHDFAIKKVDF
jgi:hypothetical protein